MKLTKTEAIVAWAALNVTAKGEQKTFPFTQLADVGKTAKELKSKCTVDEKFEDTENEVELDTDCKKLLKDSLEREWPAQYAEDVISLKEKLSQ